MSPTDLQRFDAAPWSGLPHGTTTVGVAPNAIPPKANAIFRQPVLSPVGEGWVSLNQQHTDRIVCLDDPGALEALGEAGCDGAATESPQRVLTIQTADCVPLFLYDPNRPAIGLVHAGWRGAESGIVENALTLMQRRYQTDPATLYAAMGPAAGGCCYEVGPEVAEKFRVRAQQMGVGEEAKWLGPSQRDAEKRMLDLRGYLRRLLEALGVRSVSIQLNGHCTICRADRYPSFRRQGERSGRMLSFLGL